MPIDPGELVDHLLPLACCHRAGQHTCRVVGECVVVRRRVRGLPHRHEVLFNRHSVDALVGVGQLNPVLHLQTLPQSLQHVLLVAPQVHRRRSPLERRRARPVMRPKGGRCSRTSNVSPTTTPMRSGCCWCCTWPHLPMPTHTAPRGTGVDRSRCRGDRRRSRAVRTGLGTTSSSRPPRGGRRPRRCRPPRRHCGCTAAKNSFASSRMGLRHCSLFPGRSSSRGGCAAGAAHPRVVRRRNRVSCRLPDEQGAPRSPRTVVTARLPLLLPGDRTFRPCLAAEALFWGQVDPGGSGGGMPGNVAG